ncbi:MAG TPA: BrnA antitoxin family protein [Terriglobia bacterium]|nr:BrnA antitoxin family protein [Terriglobia bacterium]
MKKKTKRLFGLSRLGPPSPTKGGPKRKLTREQKRDIAAIARKRDEEIDFSDAPPVLDWTGAEIGKFYRPMKKPVTMRLDSDIIDWLKSGGRGYQTRANWLLRHAMLHHAKQKRAARREMISRLSAGRQRKGSIS